jgi:dipeptidyl-peptidase-4
MRKVFVLLFIWSLSLTAQKNEITIDKIWNGEFRPQYIYGLKALPSSDYYSKIIYDSSSKTYEIGIFDYPTQKKISTAFSTKNYPEIGYFDYQFSKDENKILIGTNIKPIYRHSSTGIYYVFDRQTNKLTKVSEKPIQEPSLSPNNSKIAFVQNNNLFYKDLKSGQTVQISFDGQKNRIINGIPDWVYEEEFSYSKAYEWNPDGSMIAYAKFDETEVPEYSMIKYDEQLYPEVVTFKYPKAGEKNSKVTLHLYKLNTGKNIKINIDTKYEYLPRIQWTKKSDCLTFITLNRLQNQLKLHKYNATYDKSGVIVERNDPKYVDLEATDNLTFLENGNFIWSSEEDGWNHFYLYDYKGHKIRQITKGNWEITDFYGYNAKTKKLFYQSTETGSINRAVYSIDLKGKNKKLLSPENGTSSAEFSAKFKYFINTFSNNQTPYTYTINRGKDGKILKILIDNKQLLEKLSNYELPEKTFIQLPGADGTMLNAYVIKGKKSNNKSPLLVYQYSGPNVQTVRNSWYSYNDYYHFLLAQKGYTVISIDPRGTGGRGAEFKKATYKQLGKIELEDLSHATLEYATKNYLDTKRIGIWGWSYGGFMSSNAILKKPDVFSLSIAVAPVTNWRFYDTVYTERYLQTPQDNPEGYDQNSPLFFTENLQGKFFLVHGSLDDNVHLQNSMRLSKKLQENDQPFDQMIYTDKNHGIYGKKTRHHLYKKMLNFIINNL